MIATSLALQSLIYPLVFSKKWNRTSTASSIFFIKFAPIHCLLVAPNGIMYVNQHVRKGLLGRMLTELLDTRVMVKQAMKGMKTDKVYTHHPVSPSLHLLSMV